MEKHSVKMFASRAALVALLPITILDAVCGLICRAWTLGYADVATAVADEFERTG